METGISILFLTSGTYINHHIIISDTLHEHIISCQINLDSIVNNSDHSSVTIELIMDDVIVFESLGSRT